MTIFNLEEHLAKEHKITGASAYIKEMVYGGTDGIVTTFAVVSGFAGASASRLDLPILAVLIFGFANLFADGVSMGLGDFLSSRSEKDVYKKTKEKEAYEIKVEPDEEAEESEEILQRKGFSQKDSQMLVSIYRKNPAYWVHFMMNEELELPNVEKDKPFVAAIFTFFSFLVFGFIPILPYLIFQGQNMFGVATAATGLALLILGALRSRVSTLAPIRSVLETLLVGGTASTVAYLVGSFFHA